MTAVFFGIGGVTFQHFVLVWMRFGEKSVAAVLVGGFVAGRMEAGLELDQVGDLQVERGDPAGAIRGLWIGTSSGAGKVRHESGKAPRISFRLGFTQ